jgi:hypothetical protein
MYKITKRLAELLVDHIVGPNGTKVFNDRYTLHFPGDDEIEKAGVALNNPYMSILNSPKFQRKRGLAKTEPVQTISDIVHTGSSVASYSLSGKHIGNNNYVLEITLSGPLSVAAYRLSDDGGESFRMSEVISGNGQVEIGDGTTIVFGSEGNLVAGDRYIWNTVSVQKQTHQTHSFTTKASISIHCGTERELYGEGNFVGYIDQLLSFFQRNGHIHDGKYIYQIDLDEGSQPYMEKRNDTYYGVLIVIISGELYYEKQVPLIGETAVEV